MNRIINIAIITGMAVVAGACGSSAELVGTQATPGTGTIPSERTLPPDTKVETSLVDASITVSSANPIPGTVAPPPTEPAPPAGLRELAAGPIAAQFFGVSVAPPDVSAVSWFGPYRLPPATLFYGGGETVGDHGFLQLRFPDRTATILLTRRDGPLVTLLDGVDIRLADAEETAVLDCRVDGVDSQGMVFAVAQVAPKEPSWPATKAWRISDDGEHLTEIDPAGVACLNGAT